MLALVPPSDRRCTLAYLPLVPLGRIELPADIYKIPALPLSEKGISIQLYCEAPEIRTLTASLED